MAVIIIVIIIIIIIIIIIPIKLKSRNCPVLGLNPALKVFLSYSDFLHLFISM